MRKTIANIFSALVPFKSPRGKVRHLIKHGLVVSAIGRYLKVFKEGSLPTFPNFLSVCAIAKNEGIYFKEWLEYHRLIGVEKFYIYDNGSNDGTFDILKPYIDEGIVEYVNFPGERMQRPAYLDCLKKCEYRTKWLAVIDLDEFIVPLQNDDVKDFLRNIPNDVSQVLLCWSVYGSSGHVKKPEGLVIENYMYRAKHNLQSKPIVKPRMVLSARCNHNFVVINKTVDEYGTVINSPRKFTSNNDVLRINHYHCKSLEEYKVKIKKGDAFYGKDDNKHNQELFKKMDNNDLFDPAITRFIDKTKERLKSA